jgi:hypothetical protein
MEPTGCPKMLVTNYQSILYNIPEKQRSNLHLNRHLKSVLMLYRNQAFSRSKDLKWMCSLVWTHTAFHPPLSLCLHGSNWLIRVGVHNIFHLVLSILMSYTTGRNNLIQNRHLTAITQFLGHHLLHPSLLLSKMVTEWLLGTLLSRD